MGKKPPLTRRKARVISRSDAAYSRAMALTRRVHSECSKSVRFGFDSRVLECRNQLDCYIFTLFATCVLLGTWAAAGKFY
jgi:hypothetical protein